MDYILQKGYIRTCTNYARVLLERNFESKVITVAKHNDREGLHENMERYIEMVKEQNAWPYDLSAEEIQDLYDKDKFKYIICIKNPYSWFHSVSKTGPSMHRPDPSNPWPVIENFNNRYGTWLDIIENNEKNSFIIRHEDLLNNFEGTMNDIYNKLSLAKTLSRYSNEKRDVLGQHKGQKRVGNTAYSQRLNKHSMPLGENGQPIYDRYNFDRIREEVDWAIMARYGYDKYDDNYEELYEIR
jgi:hypothetical protein